ncbi:MAG: hypothetical protein OXG97_17205 [Candidatus Poribacteria bacterium]|nr:hypothetical protein [Candidatus Poribacteria bacterium]
MKLDLCFTLFCAAVIAFAFASTEVAHAQSIEDGLGGHWTFDKSDTDAKVAKDALGENDGEIKGAPKIVEGIVGDALRFNTRSHVVVAVGHDRNAFIKPFYFDGDIDDVAVYHRALDDKEVMDNYQIAFDVEPTGKLALTWGAIKAH